MDTTLLVAELARVALQTFFAYSRITKMTPDEVDAMYEEEKRKFLQNDPEGLPDALPSDEDPYP